MKRQTGLDTFFKVPNNNISSSSVHDAIERNTETKVENLITPNSWLDPFVLDIDSSWSKYLEEEVGKQYFKNLLVKI